MKKEKEATVESLKVMTAQDVSDRLRISLSTVHHLTRTGQIKAVKIGKQWRYSEEDVENYLQGGFDFRKLQMERRKGDRRTFPRTNCFIQGHASVSVFPIKRWEGEGAALNLSEGGLLFEVNELSDEEQAQINQDDPVMIALYFPSGYRRELEIPGKIIHLDSQDDDKFRFGVKFGDLSPELQKTIRDYLG